MKIKSLLPIAFGKFHLEEPIFFQNGLNIILGENEKGKSTLVAFILGMFYGFKKEGKTRVSRTLEYERYRPWKGTEYKGVMVYECDGRLYRVERRFDPDTTKIYDDATGEDITRTFSQDSRKEYDFAQRHLGLSGKEFKNTIWIGQLGSSQEPDLGVEIQGKLESVLQGSSEGHSFAKALTALSEEKAKIKTPRSTRAKLDRVCRKIQELESELQKARAREQQIRDWLLEVFRLNEEKQKLEVIVKDEEKNLLLMRYALLRHILLKAHGLKSQIRELTEEINSLSWAKELPENCEENFTHITEELQKVSAKINEITEELNRLSGKRKELEHELKTLDQVASVGLSEADIVSLHSKYLSAKAQASRGERLANEARKELRKLEEEQELRGLAEKNVTVETLKKAEEYRETLFLAEKEKSRMDLEVERARSDVARYNPGSASAWIYTLALGMLGLAVFFTVMGMPFSMHVFGLSLLIFGVGVYRYRSVSRLRCQALEVLAKTETELNDQVQRVENARKVLSEFLAEKGVKTVEELRAIVREVSAYKERLRSCREKYEVAHSYWFEASQEFSSVEKELIAALKTAGCLSGQDVAIDSAVESLKSKISVLASVRKKLSDLEDRRKELETVLFDLEKRRSSYLEREKELLERAGVNSEGELWEKVETYKRYKNLCKTVSELQERLRSLLAGRNLNDLQEELSRISRQLDGLCQTEDYGSASPANSGEASIISETEYESRRSSLDKLKARLADVRAKIMALENGIRIRSQEGRSVAEIEEELAREKDLEQELLEDKEALELAICTLESLSKSIRRQFVPLLNKRVGEILAMITRGKYLQVRVSPDLEMSVIDPETRKPIPISRLSGGTLDQCYFALRVAVAEIITGKNEFPLFLDDPFVQYDDARLEGAINILGRISKRHQILLFSCHGREESIARRLGINCNVIRL